MSGTTYEQGEIVLIPFPFSSDTTQSKQRPALVVSNSTYNAGTQQLVLCGITSNLSNKGFHVAITQRDMESGNLVANSLIKYSNIYTLNKSLIIKKIGKVNSKILKAVTDGLRVILQ